ncbi:glycosyltransferase family 1 protein [Terrisporobacter mayombei]|uniref:glycosyltransferase family 1 protein n=1 Tax=Terrisporobacter mayombei TaxID=1541 RepID=UPI0026594E2A|nr:glycosyltransferase family 1 protein [Terrisporobacter mayombei]MCC3670626.1 glycosyltransferase family 1 protein [Terrisporobacter mayombei]
MGRGGAETMAMNLYRNIDRSKVQFDFIVHTEKKCDYDDEINLLGGKIYRVPRYKGINHFIYRKQWIEFFRKHPEYDIIHGHMRSTASIYLNIAKKYGLKTISHSHNSSSGKGISSIIKNIMQYKIKYIADYLFSCSKSAGIWLYGKRRCDRENFFVLNNAIEADKFKLNLEKRENIRNELDINDKLVIGHIGRFHPQKNHEFLIEVFKLINKKNQDSVLLLVGDGELRECINEKVKKLGLEDKVIFTGVRDDVDSLVQAMDVIVFPSLYEGLPLTLIEIQVSGLPCIASDTITKDVNITKSIEYMSLESNKDLWANKILEVGKFSNRYDRYEDIVKSGYDIKTTSQWYQAFCKAIVKDELII